MPSRGREKQFLERGFHGKGFLFLAARFFAPLGPFPDAGTAPLNPDY
jgi:hypothetical protein